MLQSHSPHFLHPPPGVSRHPPDPSSSAARYPFSSRTAVTFPVAGVRLHSGAQRPWLAQLPDSVTAAPAEDGPVLLPPSSSPLSFGDPAEASPLQVATSVLLTGAISVFLFRSLRRRAERAKESRLRSTGITKKGLKEEALDNLKAMSSSALKPGAPPSPVQALLGGLSAGVIAIVLYNFSTTIEAALNRQSISDNFSVRQITITIRTIINGLCYLATFVFGANSIGLILYSGQLAINSFMGSSPSNETNDEVAESNTSSTSSTISADNEGTETKDGPQTPLDGQ